MKFSDKELRDFENIIESTLKQNSIDTKLSSLEGLRSRLNITLWETIRILYKGEKIYPKKTPVFFYQDYMLISEETLNSYSVQEVIVAPMVFDDTIKEITENKRSYLLAVVIENEIERLKQQKKGVWKGKEYDFAPPISITDEQGEEILNIIADYKFFEDTPRFEILQYVANYNLSCIYKRKQTRKVCCLLRELTLKLGDEWGKRAALYTTNGEKSLEAIKKYYLVH